MNINIADYTYDLPADRIALHPLAKRDHSKLLFYDQGNIEHRVFKDLPGLLPLNSQLYFNNTRVIPARLHFQKDTGAVIELFLLNPISPSPLLVEAMNASSTGTWKCTIGNLKRWTGPSLQKQLSNDLHLEAQLVNREEGIVTFNWTAGYSFASVLQHSGETPLPPYLKREAEEEDKERYQTIYSRHDGAVAAPTAGLHFTENVFNDLAQRNITHDFVTLHVSAGTFQPVKVANALEHTMHREQIVVSRNTITGLIKNNRFVIPVGTTSMRTLESLYWFGVSLISNPDEVFAIEQDYPYRGHVSTPDRQAALQQVSDYMDRKGIDQLTGHSAIFIHPGYTFRVCDALITNFHQPSSTLILLVAALIGEDWKRVYQQAMENNYRFLSYGDSSLLIPKSAKTP